MSDAGSGVPMAQAELGYSSFSALAEDELRRWMTHCRGLEAGESYEWPEAPSRALVESILLCLFGSDIEAVDGPARAWARSTPTMGILARRLGCLRELFGQEGAINGGESSLRLAEILDRVTIVTTQAGLAALSLADTRLDATVSAAPGSVAVADVLAVEETAVGQDGSGNDAVRAGDAVRDADAVRAAEVGTADVVDPADAVDSDAVDPTDESSFSTRRVAQGTAALVAVAVVAAMVLALWPSSPHASPARAGAHHGSSATTHASPSIPVGDGAGPTGAPSTLTGFRQPALGGPARGTTVTRGVDVSGANEPSAGGGAGSGTGRAKPGGGGSTTAGGSPGLTLPLLGGLTMPGGLTVPNTVPVPSDVPLATTSPTLAAIPAL